MGLTLSHISALDAMRTIRNMGEDLRAKDTSKLYPPSPWKGKRFASGDFADEKWQRQKPSAKHPLHILVGCHENDVRVHNVISHICTSSLPEGSILWLDENASIVCPELLFCQMGSVFDLPALVMLGHEICGHFSRSATNPLRGNTTLHVPAASTVDDLHRFMDSVSRIRGIGRARKALEYVCDNAMSAPEAVLATMYSLPPDESGYGMGPITLNREVTTNNWGDEKSRTRYPDLLFSFGPLGINYDGNNHLDLSGIARAARVAAIADEKDRTLARITLANKISDVRQKYVDDIMRNMQLAASGYLVFPAVKENLSDIASLDDFTRLLLDCAHDMLGINTEEYLKTLDGTDRRRDRADLLTSIWASCTSSGTNYGKM